MFEKEAEEYTRKNWNKNVTELKNDITYQYVKGNPHFYDSAIKQAFQKGADLGYNKARKEIKLLKETHQQSIGILTDQIEELHKANEWHYAKDGLPEELNDVLCFVIHNEHRYVLQGYLRDGRWVLSPLGTYLNNDEVIAWKEIILPKGE